MQYGIERRLWGKENGYKPAARLPPDRPTSKIEDHMMGKLIAIAAALGLLGAFSLTPVSAAPASIGVTGTSTSAQAATDISAQKKKAKKSAKKSSKKPKAKKSKKSKKSKGKKKSNLILYRIAA